eukprot:CAMPEP_0118946970 /NCGR_PEP_ID=MMETSP1169-20130426/45169_1 /TAXON_ID=36882 /ORGANISM="Pyramimonas obovata, Strain CCMP722" /LENGTH=564 /DNA_ID=CAMNT_0006893089 /DNA_START=81 /DNA_END=1772 /DNA_ORIENTATION=-
MSTVKPGEPKLTENAKEFQKYQTYNSVFVSGREVKEGNCVLIRSEENSAPPFVGHVRKIFKSLKRKKSGDGEEPVQVQVNWLYRQHEVLDKHKRPLVRDALENELFFSFHDDTVNAATIRHPCTVRFTEKVNPETEFYKNGFFCTRMYDVKPAYTVYRLTETDFTPKYKKEIKKLLALGQSQSAEGKPDVPTGSTQQKCMQKEPHDDLGAVAGASSINSIHVAKKLKSSEKQEGSKIGDKQCGDSSIEKQVFTKTSEKQSNKNSERQSERISDKQVGSRGCEVQGSVKSSDKQGGSRSGDKLNDHINAGLSAVEPQPESPFSTSTERAIQQLDKELVRIEPVLMKVEQSAMLVALMTRLDQVSVAPELTAEDRQKVDELRQRAAGVLMDTSRQKPLKALATEVLESLRKWLVDKTSAPAGFVRDTAILKLLMVLERLPIPPAHLEKLRDLIMAVKAVKCASEDGVPVYGAACKKAASSLTKTWKTLYLEWEGTETKKASKKAKGEGTSAAPGEPAKHKPPCAQTEIEASMRPNMDRHAIAASGPACGAEPGASIRASTGACAMP